MAVGAKNTEILAAVIARITVPRVDIERCAPRYGVYLAPPTRRALVPSVFEEPVTNALIDPGTGTAWNSVTKPSLNIPSIATRA